MLGVEDVAHDGVREHAELIVAVHRRQRRPHSKRSVFLSFTSALVQVHYVHIGQGPRRKPGASSYTLTSLSLSLSLHIGQGFTWCLCPGARRSAAALRAGDTYRQ